MRNLIRNLNLPQLRHAKLKTDSTAEDETEIILHHLRLNSLPLEAPPAPRSSCPELVVHTNTIRSLYPNTLEIPPFHSTDQPVLRVLLPRPILEMSELKLTMAILDVHTVDFGTLHHKIQQQQPTLEFQVSRSLVRFLFNFDHCTFAYTCIYPPYYILQPSRPWFFLANFPIYVTPYLFILFLTT